MKNYYNKKMKPYICVRCTWLKPHHNHDVRLFKDIKYVDV